MRTRLVFVAALLLVLASPLVVRSSPKAFCSADCGGGVTLTCTQSPCTAQDKNCSIGERGYLRCGSTTTQCPSACPPPPSCQADSFCDVNCPNDPDCTAWNPCGLQPINGCYYNWNPQSMCCVAVDPGLGCQNICY